MGMLQYAIDVIEGITATVNGGVYNIVSHTPVNPLLLDSTAQQLLEQAAGTSLEVIKNDLGETIGYAAKGVANATNGAATEVSTRVAVLTREVEVTAEMAAETYIEASTGEVASLTVGETVTEVSAAGTGAGVLGLEVGAAGAAIAPALGLVAGFALYNIAPSFWDGVANKLMEAGELVNGKVQGILNSDKSTGFSQGTIDVFKEAFREAGYFAKPTTDASQVTTNVSYDLTSLTQGFAFSSVDKQVILNKLQIASSGIATMPDVEFILNTLPLNAVSGKYCFIQITGSGISLWEVGNISDYFTGFSIINQNNNYNVKYSPNSSSTKYVEKVTTWLYRFSPAQDYTITNNSIYIRTPIEELNTYTYQDSFIVYSLRNGVVWTQLAQNLSLDIMGNPSQIIIPNIGNYVPNPNVQDGATLPTQDPIDTTYPNWDKQPIQGKDYYKVSMPTDDTDQSQSQSGDNDSEEQEQDITDTLFNPEPDPEPSPDPEPDPDPQPEPEPLPYPTPTPEPVPIDPNPEPDDSDGTPVVPVVPTTSSNSMFAVYNPTDGELDSLGAFLWSSSIIETIKKIWQNPLEGIIALHKIYAAPSTGSSQNILLGYVDSGVSAALVTSQFVEVDCGSVTVGENKKNATDYIPFTSIQIYLPFIGIQELDTNEIMGGSVNVKYKVDVYTGTCIAMIFVTRSPDMTSPQLLYTFSGNASQKLPLTSSDFSAGIGALLGIVGVGVASGGALALAAGAGAVAHSLTQDMVHIQHSGGLSANSGILAPRKPFLIISRQYGYDANNYADIYGFPANKTIYLSSCSGYVRVKHINYRGRGTESEKREIVSLLKEGVIA